jgi:hypothetical protein
MALYVLQWGTAPGFGVINAHKNVLRTLSGENWDLGDLWLKTRSKDPHVLPEYMTKTFFT